MSLQKRRLNSSQSSVAVCLRLVTETARVYRRPRFEARPRSAAFRSRPKRRSTSCVRWLGTVEPARAHNVQRI